MSEDEVKRLAEAKSYLETKLEEIEREATSLRSILNVFDEVLAEKSFKRVKIEKKKVEIPSIKAPQKKIELDTEDGIPLGELAVKDDELLLTLREGIHLRSDLSPFTSFLVNRVLEPIREQDSKSVSSDSLHPKEAFNYEVFEDSGVLKGIRIFNYGDDRRFNELKNAIRWTLRKLYEKSNQF